MIDEIINNAITVFLWMAMQLLRNVLITKPYPLWTPSGAIILNVAIHSSPWKQVVPPDKPITFHLLDCNYSYSRSNNGDIVMIIIIIIVLCSTKTLWNQRANK